MSSSRAHAGRWLATAVGALLACSATGCGVGTDDAPRLLPADDIPESLREAERGAPDLVGEPVQVYLLSERGGHTRLVAVTRRVDDTDDAGARLRALVRGAPTDGEASQGLVSRVPADTALLGVSLNAARTTITVALESDLNVQGEGLRQALAQLVWTVTEREELREASVRFTVDGEATGAIDDRGNERDQVNRSDYAELEPD